MSTEVLAQIKVLEARIEQLRLAQTSELKVRLQEARRTVSELEAELAKLTGQPAVLALPLRRLRTSPEEVRRLILKVLAETPTGLSAREVANAAGLNYTTVLNFLSQNAKAFKTTGTLRSKRYFLK